MKRRLQLMTDSGGITDKAAVMQSNYTAIVMGLKRGSVKTLTPAQRGCERGLLISRRDPGLTGPSTIPHFSHTQAVIEKQLVYLGESLQPKEEQLLLHRVSERSLLCGGGTSSKPEEKMKKERE